MGVGTNIYIPNNLANKLVNKDWESFYFLVELSHRRWHRFEELLNSENSYNEDRYDNLEVLYLMRIIEIPDRNKQPQYNPEDYVWEYDPKTEKYTRKCIAIDYSESDDEINEMYLATIDQEKLRDICYKYKDYVIIFQSDSHEEKPTECLNIYSIWSKIEESISKINFF